MKKTILLLLGGAVLVWILLLAANFHRWLLWGSESRKESKESVLKSILIVNDLSSSNNTDRCVLLPILSVWQNLESIIPVLSNQTVNVDYKMNLVDNAVVTALARERLSFDEWIGSRKELLGLMKSRQPTLLSNKLVRFIDTELEPIRKRSQQEFSTNCTDLQVEQVFSFFTNSLSAHVFELEHKFITEYEAEVMSAHYSAIKRR
jgi:hypothetical protein